ncbi:MAG TPA: hypothetical protein VMA71_02560 [Alloacidobacterium sp.]|nr:hypothetical protein [Alloacidobacterium sp.]
MKISTSPATVCIGEFGRVAVAQHKAGIECSNSRPPIVTSRFNSACNLADVR